MPLIRKGAEANLYLEEWYGLKVVVKRRVSKSYRVPELDFEIRRYRTIHESQLIHGAKLAGVPTPTLYVVDTVNMLITMEYVEGRRVKEVLDDLTPEGRLDLCQHIGRLIGQLHKRGIIHGDLTTSNMIVSGDGRVFLIDFGLGEFSDDVEERGVDLLLVKRALQSTHYRYARGCFEAVCDGYAKEMGGEAASPVFDRVRGIERRGRYVSER